MPEDPHPSLLIVDDDPLITETLSYALGKDFEVMVSDSRHHAVSLLRQLDEAPQLALVDLGLPPMPHRPDEGFQLISDLLAHSPTMKILVLSGQNDAANARHARRRRVRRKALRSGESQEDPASRSPVSRRRNFGGRDRRGRPPGRQKPRAAETEESNQPIRRLA